MAFARPFAYNPGTLIPGTEQVGNLSVGAPTSGFTTNPQYWNGPDEQLGYIIAQSVSGNTQPTPLFGVTASVGFFRTEDFTDESFIDLSETIAQQSFANAANAKTWLNDNGYWTSYGLTIPLTITLEGFYFEGSVGAGYQAIANQVLNDDVSISFTNVLGTITGPPLLISGSVVILSGQTSGYTQTFTDYNYNNLTQESSFTGITFNVTGSTEYGFTSEVSGSTFDVTPTPTPTNTETPSITLTGETPTPTPTGTPTGTPEAETPTPTPTETEVPTPTPTVTPTGTPESETATPTPTVTETPTGTPSETPTNTPTPTSTDLSSVTTFTISGCTNLNVLVADLGPSSLAPGDVFKFTFTGGTPSGCYRIVEKTVATPTDGATPLFFYVNCAACQETLVTPTPSVTPTLTPTTTSTPTPTPTSGATAPFSVSFVESGSNILMSYSGTLDLTGLDFVQNTTSGSGGVGAAQGAFGIGPSGALDISLYTGATFSYPSNFGTGGGGPSSVTGTGDYFGVFSGLYPTNTLVVPTGYTSGNFIQGTTTLSGSSFTSLGINTGNYNYSWGAGAGQSFVLTIGGAGVTPTPTATSVTPTPTPTSGATGDGWLFYGPEGPITVGPPDNNGNSIFVIQSTTTVTYNPNYTGATLNIYFNSGTTLGTSYLTQFQGLDVSGGTLTASQGSNTVIYSGNSSEYVVSPTGFLQLTLNRTAQMVQSASTPFVSGTSINVVVS